MAHELYFKKDFIEIFTRLKLRAFKSRRDNSKIILKRGEQKKGIKRI